MSVSIKARLVLLLFLALAALSCASILSIVSSSRISRYNDMARVTQSNKMLAERMITTRLTAAAQYYEIVQRRAGSPVETRESLVESAQKFQDLTERLIGRTLPYLKADDLRRALLLGTDIIGIVQTELPRLIAAGAGDDAFTSLTSRFRQKIAELSDLHAAIDEAVGDDLSEISDHVHAEAERTTRDVGIVFGVSMVVLSVLLTLIIRGITKPLAAITATMHTLAAGDLSVTVPEKERRDEIGTMALAVEVFKENGLENRRLTEAKALEQAQIARKQAAMDAHTRDFGRSIAGVMSSLVGFAADMSTAANEMSDAARRTMESSSTASEGATNSAHDLNTVAVAAEQMAASINEISRQVAHVTASVAHAVERAAATDATVTGMAEGAERIGDVVKLITDIASKTNLLALNATIEAARAGEAGKGFAVVAGEVKTLAAQTAQATEQISRQIVAIRDATGQAVAAVRDVGQAIGEVESVATAIAAAVEQQAAATQEISGSVQKVTGATNAAVGAMGHVLTTAERAKVVSQSVLTAASGIGDTSDTLRTEVNDFLTAMTTSESHERHAYERIPGAGAMATIRTQGQPAMTAAIRDISLGGVALKCACKGAAGDDLRITLRVGGEVSGRIVEATPDVLRVSFRQDTGTIARVTQELQSIRQNSRLDQAA